MTETQNTSAGYPSDYIQRTKAILDCLMSELEMVRSQRSELDDRERGLVERIAPLSAIVGDVHTADDVDTQPTPTAGEPAPHLLLEEGGRRPSEIQRDARAGTPRGLAGKPLAGFCTTPSRRITAVLGVIIYVIRRKNQLLHRLSTSRN